MCSLKKISPHKIEYCCYCAPGVNARYGGCCCPTEPATGVYDCWPGYAGAGVDVDLAGSVVT